MDKNKQKHVTNIFINIHGETNEEMADRVLRRMLPSLYRGR